MSTILAVSLPYAELAFWGVLALALIIGAIRGFSKSFKGLFLTIAIILCSVCLIGPTFNGVRQTDISNKLDTAITQGISKEEFMTLPIYVEVDTETHKSVFYVDVETGEGTQRVLLEEALGSGVVSKTKARFASWLAERFITEDGQTLGGVAGKFLTDCVLAVIMFVVYCVALGIVCAIIRMIFKRMHNSENKLLKVIDGSLGAIISAAFALMFVFVALAVLNALKDKIPVVHEALSNGKVVSYFYQNNPIVLLWTKIFG